MLDNSPLPKLLYPARSLQLISSTIIHLSSIALLMTTASEYPFDMPSSIVSLNTSLLT
ncbi:MAG: hypothetical protein Q6363_008890 [Candidatus Njordarchaeota archaeon]